MTSPDGKAVTQSVAVILAEIFDGAKPEVGWLLNPGDIGMLRFLDSLSAREASAVPQGGTSSIASHVAHLCFALELLNRASHGESPFNDAAWNAAWRETTVSDVTWDRLREQLRAESRKWRERFSHLVDSGESQLTDVMASTAHLAYHFGAIRQIQRAVGPLA
jgi:hypothetical protein